MMGIAATGSERAQALFRCKAPQHTIVRTMRMLALGRARLRSPNRVNVEVRYSFGIDFECPATITHDHSPHEDKKRAGTTRFTRLISALSLY